MENLRNNIAKDRANLFGILSTLGLLALVTINDLITLYHEFPINPIFSILALSLGVFILINIYGNMFRAISVDTSIYSNPAPSIQLIGWKYCSICEQYAPPRSYHCLTCDKCILKRHNHCLFLAKCIGYKNIRFYLLFIVYVWFGTLLSNVINLNFYLNSINSLSFKSILKIFVPWLAWLFGLITLKDFFFTFTNTITVILFFLIFFYFLININLVLNNQTWYEKSKKIHYKSSKYENLIEAIGFNWKSAFFWPFITLKLPNNGSHFSQEFNNVLNLKNV